MRRIVLAGNDAEGWAEFLAGLVRNGEVVEIIKVDSAAAVLDVVQRKAADLVVVGEALADSDPIACVTCLVRLDPRVHCALVSTMAVDAFHAATEGLGVLMQLPPDPSGANAATLLAKMQALDTLLEADAVQGARR